MKKNVACCKVINRVGLNQNFQIIQKLSSILFWYIDV